MDGLVIIMLCLVMFFTHMPTAETKAAEESAVPVVQATAVQLNPYLNPGMYHDEQAFTLIANELGFH